MAYKQFALDEQTIVTIYKRRGNRSLRLTVVPCGEVRVTIPIWAPYKTGLDFAKARREWIAAQRPVRLVLRSGQAIGKAHHLRFVADAVAVRATSRVRPGEVTVTHPASLSSADAAVQQAAEAASIRALRRQAEQLLPARVRDLAARYGFDYKSVTVKQLKSRWGSCDQHRNLVFNLFLMQLPWELIDYVIVHELVHTEILHHGPDFWQAMRQRLPAAQQLRRQIREFQPVLRGEAPAAMA